MKILSFFDKLEDKIRHNLSRHPVPYALIGGISIVLFWRAVTELADMLPHVHPIWWFIGTVLVMLLTGIFVSFFVGENIIISGLKSDKRVDEKTELELQREEEHLKHLYDLVHDIRKDIKEIKAKLNQ